MKKFLCVFLAVLFVAFSFTGCKGNKNDEQKEATVAIASLNDLNGKKVAVQNDTTSDYFAQALLDKGEIKFEILRYEKIIQCYDDMALKRVDAILVDEVVAAAYMDVSKVVWSNTEGEPIGICIKKGNDDFAAIVEDVVDTFYFDGTIATIANKYFGRNVTEGVRTVTAAPELDLSKLKTLNEGVLKVGMEVGYPPMEYVDTDGITPIGFDVELAGKIAEKLGLKLEIVNTAWDGIFAALDNSEFDMIMSSVSITPERQEKFILTEPYISNKIVLVVPGP